VAAVVSRTGARVVATTCGAGGGADALVRTTELVVEPAVTDVLDLVGAELLVTVAVAVMAAGSGGLPALAGPEAAIRPR
jgi:hypothetical protein